MIERQARFRVAILAVGALLAALWFGFGGGESAVILIEFGISPQDLVGTEVVIDGEVAGTLERMGSRTQTGFRVKDGDHVVTLRHPELRTRQTRVTSGFGGERVLLVVDFGQDAAGEPVLVLNR